MYIYVVPRVSVVCFYIILSKAFAKAIINHKMVNKYAYTGGLLCLEL